MWQMNPKPDLWTRWMALEEQLSVESSWGPFRPYIYLRRVLLERNITATFDWEWE